MSEHSCRRIVIVGSTGSGKTTMARSLADCLGIPHVELDALHWEPDWAPAEPDVFRARVHEALRGDAWVTDGNYGSVRDLVWPRANTLVWLDLPLTHIMTSLIRRTARRVRTHEELWNGNRESLQNQLSRDSLFLWALSNFHRHRKQYTALLFDSNDYSHLDVIHLRSRRAATEWLGTIALAEKSPTRHPPETR